MLAGLVAGMVPEQKGKMEEERAHEEGAGKAGAQRSSSELQRRTDSTRGAEEEGEGEAAEKIAESS